MKRPISNDGNSAELGDFGPREEDDEDDEVDKNEDDDEEESEKEEEEEEDVDSIADSDDSYTKERLAEEREYGERNAKEAKMELEEQRIFYDFQRAEEKKDPRDRSYWRNPATELVGVHVKKLFRLHDWFEGVVVSYDKPYFRIDYTDGDFEQLNLNEVLEIIDLDYFTELYHQVHHTMVSAICNQSSLVFFLQN